jgi:hypothetical protein
MRVSSALLAIGLVPALTAGLLLNVCDLLYDCGCTWAWAGAVAHCNIHQSEGPHCPWCAHGPAGFALIFGLTALAEISAARGPARSLGARMTASLIAGAVTLLALGLLFARNDRYPTFLGSEMPW